MDNYEARRAKHRAAVAEATISNRKTVFEALAALHITTVTVEFDGENDSGDVHTVCVYAGNEHVELPKTPITMKNVRTIYAADGGTTTVTDSQEPMTTAIEMLCLDHLQHEHSGWEIDGGAYGAFHFDVAARTIQLAFSYRHIETIHTDYDV
jgi:hypothetical protein